MADETKAPQIENPEKITAKDVDGRNGNMLVEFDGVGKCVILGRLLRKIKKYPKIKDKNFGNTKIMRIFAA